MDEIFAKVSEDQVLQYPLTLQDINNANDPTGNYLYCWPQAKPTYDPLVERLVDEPRVFGNIVIVNYRVERKTLEELFADIGLGEGSTITIQDVPTNMLQAVITLTKERVQARLDAFAQTRGYDDVKSICTYINSQIPQYQVESARAIYLRDFTWSTLYTYLSGIESGTTPLPNSVSDIDAILPTLDWDGI